MHAKLRPAEQCTEASCSETARTGVGRPPGVSMIVRFGQYLYSILTTISLAQNCCSRSSRAFSFSMYSCAPAHGQGRALRKRLQHLLRAPQTETYRRSGRSALAGVACRVQQLGT